MEIEETKRKILNRNKIVFASLYFPYFEISAVYTLIGDVNSSSCKLISKAERKKMSLYLSWNLSKHKHKAAGHFLGY